MSAQSVIEAIGKTPLIKLRQASKATGCAIYGKAEFMNPGGSIKDRAALAIVSDAVARGTLKPGMAADLAIFDFDHIACPERPEVRFDLPGGGRRLVTEAQGVKYTIVNGSVLFEDGHHSGALPGRVLRSGSSAT